jgi:hypothetical protein
VGPTVDKETSFHYILDGSDKKIFSLQARKTDATLPYFGNDPSVQYTTTDSKSLFVANRTNITFNHTFVDKLLRETSSNSLDNFFTAFNKDASNATDDLFGKANTSTYNELRSPYGLYNWEMGLHAPMLLVQSTGNPRVEISRPAPVPAQNPHPHNGYGFLSGSGLRDPYPCPYPYPLVRVHGFADIGVQTRRRKRRAHVK